MTLSVCHFQVLSPTKRNACGTVHLNSHLQALLNPLAPNKQELPVHSTSSHRSSSSSSSSGPVWRVGDRVVHLVNDTERDVYNGDLGFVQSVDALEGSLVVAYPPRSGSDGATHLVTYKAAEAMEQLQLAWAITVHKVGAWSVQQRCVEASSCVYYCQSCG
jgi:exodeoxyribonuclease V alpha subunit